MRQVLGIFDVPDKKEIVHEWNVSLPIEEKPWHIGLIVGPSGAGKTTLATELFPKAYLHKGFEWPARASLLDAFPEGSSIKDITSALNAVGFSSPPHWLKSWHHLSNGQKFRAELARCLLLDVETVVFDEFTSVVDRDVAKICSAARGEKREEYRRKSPHWKRFFGTLPPGSEPPWREIFFRNGYNLDRPWMRVELVRIREGQWQGEACYVLELGRVLETGNWVDSRVDSPVQACLPIPPA